jgi:ABC-2 type transport system permease protein
LLRRCKSGNIAIDSGQGYQRMFAIFSKEIKQFFSSLIGYIAVGVFLALVGFLVWFSPDTNILDSGYATMDYFFSIAPFILMLLIPAVTMRSFSEEIQTGTIELLSTKPITDIAVIMGKFMAALALVAIAILPTVIYFYTIWQLASPVGNVDTGGTLGSYFGLLFLSAVFISVCLFTSSLTRSQIVAFLGGVAICFVIFYGIEGISKLGSLYAHNDYTVEQLGLYAHYQSMGRGILDTRDVVYFLSVITLFTMLTRVSLASRRW